MVHLIHTLPRTKCVELLNLIRIAADTPHRRLLPVYPGSPPGPQGGTQSLPGEIPHIHGGAERGFCMDAEPS